MRTHTHGTSGPLVVVLHGGPGAPGSATSLAQGLARSFRVLEPWQRGSGRDPLTVARHVDDLHGLIENDCGGRQPALMGHSWGAMLALAYAAAHPDQAGPLVLVGCGTFDPVARARLQAILDERMDAGLRQRLQCLPQEFPDPAQRLRVMYELIRPLYSFDPIAPSKEENGLFDEGAHRETWEDMVRLQQEGVYPAAFAAIRSPVLMLHGAYDPHPGRMIRDSLRPYLPRLEYREWERCGHEPWMESAVRDEFFSVLEDWLRRHVNGRTED